jgi:hypothetical protein
MRGSHKAASSRRSPRGLRPQDARCRTGMADRQVEALGFIVKANSALIIRAFVFDDVSLPCLALSERPQDRLGKGVLSDGQTAAAVPALDQIRVWPTAKCQPGVRAKDCAIGDGFEGVCHRGEGLRLRLARVTSSTRCRPHVVCSRWRLRGQGKGLSLLLSPNDLGRSDDANRRNQAAEGQC